MSETSVVSSGIGGGPASGASGAATSGKQPSSSNTGLQPPGKTGASSSQITVPKVTGAGAGVQGGSKAVPSQPAAGASTPTTSTAQAGTGIEVTMSSIQSRGAGIEAVEVLPSTYELRYQAVNRTDPTAKPHRIRASVNADDVAQFLRMVGVKKVYVRTPTPFSPVAVRIVPDKVRIAGDAKAVMVLTLRAFLEQINCVELFINWVWEVLRRKSDHVNQAVIFARGQVESQLDLYMQGLMDIARGSTTFCRFAAVDSAGRPELGLKTKGRNAIARNTPVVILKTRNLSGANYTNGAQNAMTHQQVTDAFQASGYSVHPANQALSGEPLRALMRTGIWIRPDRGVVQDPRVDTALLDDNSLKTITLATALQDYGVDLQACMASSSSILDMSKMSATKRAKAVGDMLKTSARRARRNIKSNSSTLGSGAVRTVSADGVEDAALGGDAASVASRAPSVASAASALAADGAEDAALGQDAASVASATSASLGQDAPSVASAASARLGHDATTTSQSASQVSVSSLQSEMLIQGTSDSVAAAARAALGSDTLSVMQAKLGRDLTPADHEAIMAFGADHATNLSLPLTKAFKYCQKNGLSHSIGDVARLTEHRIDLHNAMNS